MSDTSTSGCTPGCVSSPDTLTILPRRSALSSRSQSCWLALSRLRHWQVTLSPSRPGDKVIGFAVGWHERPARLTVLVPARLWPRLAYRQFRQHTLCVRSAPASLHYFILIALTLLTREPLQRGIKLRTMWRCLHCRCFTVTLTASRIAHPARCRPHRGSQRASLQASFTPTHRSA